MKPLIILLTTFILALLAIRITSHHYDIAFSARIAMSAMLLFTAIGHFVYTKGMTLMLPSFIPFKKEIVYSTGIIELLAAIGLHVPSLRVLTAWLLIVFFLVLLPSNIYAAIKRIDYQKGTSDGAGLNYLWFRVPLQALFIVWTYLSAIKS